MRWSIEQLQRAWQVASQFHNGQKYKGQQEGQSVEYINHIGSVVLEVMAAVQLESQLDADLALACAALHDTLEDTALDYVRLEAQFGSAIAQGVQALTKNEQLPTKQEQMQDSLARIRQQPQSVWAVKMADRICNLQPPPYHWSSQKKQTYQQEAQMIYEQLHPCSPYLAQRLQDKIKAYEQYF
jgi:(p)ppGpp synthase/HD superfamily hydrolase